MTSRKPLSLMAFSVLLLTPMLAWAEGAAPSLDERIGKFFADFTGPFVGLIFHSVELGGTKFPLIVGWLVVAATVFTLYFMFIQVRGFKHAIELVRGDYSNPDDKGEMITSRHWPLRSRALWA